MRPISETSNDFVTLEGLVDSYGMQAVVSALSAICSSKADHLVSDWGEDDYSRAVLDWKAAAKVLDTCANRKSIAHVNQY